MRRASAPRPIAARPDGMAKTTMTTTPNAKAASALASGSDHSSQPAPPSHGASTPASPHHSR